jgi:predicted GIY-YIG superfamily endonuclease
MVVNPQEPRFYTYILRCANNTLYIGTTDDLPTRLARHNAGKASHHTARHRPVILAFTEGPYPYHLAIARERQIKRWSRPKKEALLSNNPSALNRFSKSHERADAVQHPGFNPKREQRSSP